MKISIRKKATKKGYHLYLDNNQQGKDRYEFLNLYLLDEKLKGEKLTPKEKERNKEVLVKVEMIKAQRMQEYHEGVFRLYGLEKKKRCNPRLWIIIT
jgi:hypothetical protein